FKHLLDVSSREPRRCGRSIGLLGGRWTWRGFFFLEQTSSTSVREELVLEPTAALADPGLDLIGRDRRFGYRSRWCSVRPGWLRRCGWSTIARRRIDLGHEDSFGLVHSDSRVTTDAGERSPFTRASNDVASL